MTYPEAFERLWSEYPQRPNNPKKPAFKQYQRRILEGIQSHTLTAAVVNYAAQMRYSRKLGTEFVMQAQTFLGPNERWVEFVPKVEYAPVRKRDVKKWEARGWTKVEERIDGRPFLREILEKLATRKAIQ